MAPLLSTTLLLDQVRLVEDLHGKALVAEAIASLPPTVRRELDEMLPGRWCSIETARVFKQAVAERLGEPLLAFQRRVVRLGVERTLNTFWRFFIRQLNDEHLIRRTPTLYRRTFDRGELRFIAKTDRQAQFEVHGWPNMPEFEIVGLSAGIEAVLALAGRVEPQTAATRSGVVVHLLVTWKASRAPATDR
jgi:hypothetical protein